MGSAVQVTRQGGVATVTIDNPPVNSLADAVLDGIVRTFSDLADDAQIRAVVIAAGGDHAFVAGADLVEFERKAGDGRFIADHTALTRKALDAIELSPKPVVAAVHATAVGGGLEVALACDLVVTRPGVRFGLPEVTLGLIPGAGGTYRLPRKTSLAFARQLILAGRLVSAERAHSAGLVDVLVEENGDVLSEAQALAARLAAQPASAMQAAKLAMQDPGRDAALAHERALFIALFSSPDFREGAQAFLAKRPPVFTHDPLAEQAR